MSRQWPWRNKPTPAESTLLAAVDSGAIRLFLIAELGATQFLVRDDSGTKHRVRIGSQQVCDCHECRPGQVLCQHVLWVMARLLRVPASSPVSYQLALTENEITDIFDRRDHQRQQRRPAADPRLHTGIRSTTVQPKPIDDDDVCAVCQDALIGDDDSKPLTCCSQGCGSSLHAACMRVWAEHQSHSTGSVTCPMCRQQWRADFLFTEIVEQLKRDERTIVTATTDAAATAGTKTGRKSKLPVLATQCRVRRRCSECTGVIKPAEPLYRCASCPSYHTCRQCFKLSFARTDTNSHSHLFVQRHNDRWCVPSVRHNDMAQRQTLRDLQTRELSASDYELLLSLDSKNAPLYSYLSSALPSHADNEGVCVWCQSVNSHRLCTLACGDVAHEYCVSSAAMYDIDTLACPRCQQAVFPGLHGWAQSLQRAAVRKQAEAVVKATLPHKLLPVTKPSTCSSSSPSFSVDGLTMASLSLVPSAASSALSLSIHPRSQPLPQSTYRVEERKEQLTEHVRNPRLQRATIYSAVHRPKHRHSQSLQRAKPSLLAAGTLSMQCSDAVADGWPSLSVRALPALPHPRSAPIPQLPSR